MPPEPDDEQLLEQCILALENGDQAAVDALLGGVPAASRVREQLERLAALGILQAPQRSAAAMPERLGEFRLLRQLGRGGMGVVYLAEQESLRRRVALKLVHPEHLFFPGARDRFRREVLSVARLSHPGIVPIFTCGEAEGVPYYAMEYLQGASLAELLHDLGGLSPASLDAASLRSALQRTVQQKGEDVTVADAPLFHGSWVRACCRIVQAAATAVQHAHDQGVLHRDLKPSNVMLTRDGSVRLIDFGLASAQGEQRLTRSGATVGSLLYMAPEQVRGEPTAVDQRTDVYTLGVTLYEMLTLTLPHGDGSGTTRDRILTGTFEPPARRNAQVHADAEAICMLAMDPDPGRRYATPQELADDLAAFLEGKAVRARRLPAWLRAQRWTRRHPARATALLALLLLAVGASWYAIEQQAARTRIQSALEVAKGEHQRAEAALVEVTRQKDLVQAALIEATRQQERAGRNLEQAQRAIDQMLVRTAASRLAQVPRTAKLRQLLLEDALALREALLADSDNSQSQAAREERARTRVRLGSVREQLGDLAAAIEVVEPALTELEQLLPTSSRRPVLLRSLSNGTNTLASACRRRGDRQGDEERLLRSSCQWLERLCAEDPKAADEARIALATARTNLAVCAGRGKRSEEAHAILDAVDRDLDAERMPELSPALKDDWLLAWAGAADSRGVQCSVDGDTAAAATWFERALQRVDRIAPGERINLDVRTTRAGIVERLALIAHQRRDWQGARPWLDQAVTAYEALHQDEPDVPLWRSQLAGILGTRSDCRRLLGDAEGGAADSDRALQLLEGLVLAFPDQVAHGMRLAIALAERGSAASTKGDHATALLSFRRSIEQFGLLLQQQPGDEQALANLVAALGNCAQAEFVSGEEHAARATVTRALALCRERHGGEKDRTLIELLGQASDLALRSGDVAEARTLMAEASERATAWHAARPEDTVRQVTAMLTAVNAGTMHLTLQENHEAIAIWQAALPVARGSRPKSGPLGRRLLALMLLRLSDASVRNGDLAAARDWFQKAIAETSVRRREMEQHDTVAELFDRPDFKDLLPQAKGDK